MWNVYRHAYALRRYISGRFENFAAPRCGTSLGSVSRINIREIVRKQSRIIDIAAAVFSNVDWRPELDIFPGGAAFLMGKRRNMGRWSSLGQG